MKKLTNVGNLMNLYVEDIDPGEGTDISDFIIKASANLLSEKNERNWVPVLVKETKNNQYEVVGNSLVYAIAEEAGLDRVWCIVVEDTENSIESSKILSREKLPRINLSIASRDEISSALEYLIEKPGSVLKSVRLSIAVNRIDEAPRKYWQNLNAITKLKCGITKGKKLDTLKEVFYLTPEPIPDGISDPVVLEPMTVSELKKIAKKRGIKGLGKMKKGELVDSLSGDR